MVLMLRWAAVMTVALGMSACSGAKPFDYQEGGDIPGGPGLVSGKSGEFTVYRKSERPDDE